MKKVLCFAAAAMAIFASCQKTEVVYNNDGPQEIGIFAVNKVATKAPVDGAAFTYDKMKVAAYLAAGDGIAQGKNYFTDAVFNGNPNAASATWTGGKYWPVSAATLNFHAVAPVVNNVVTTFNNDNCAYISTTTVTNNETSQHDVMYAVNRASKTAAVAPTAVSMPFKHAYSWLYFTFKAAASSPQIKVNYIRVNDVACNGKLDVTVTNADAASDDKPLGVQQAWSAYNSTNIDVPAPVDEFVLTTSVSGYANGILLIPEDPMTSFTINYTITVDNDNHTFDYTYKPPTELTWDAGKKYTYNISMTLSEIKIEPTVVDWTDVTAVDPDLK